jgi:hypothetical protein
MNSDMTTAIEWGSAIIPDCREYDNIIPNNEIPSFEENCQIVYFKAELMMLRSSSKTTGKILSYPIKHATMWHVLS